jgi:hypothetical protein
MRLQLVSNCMKEVEIAVELGDGMLAQRCVCVLRTFLDGISRFKGATPRSLNLKNIHGDLEEIRKGKKSYQSFDDIIQPKKVNAGIPKVQLPSANSEYRLESLQNLKVHSFSLFLSVLCALSIIISMTVLI